MRRSIATVSLSGTLRQKLEAVAAARFDAIELFENDFIHFNGSARELRRMADDLGIAIDLFQPFRDFEGMPEPLLRRSLDRAERKFDLMQELGAPLMLVCSNTSPAALGEPERAAEQLHELARRAARRNLRVGYEALAWGRWVKLYGQAWRIVEQAAHPHLGLILDSFHTLSLGDDPAGIAQIPGERIFFLQMADAPRLAMDVLQWARHHRNFPGQGQFDLAGFFEQVLRAGYTGTLSLEIFNDLFRATPNRRTALDAMRSLLFLESQARARLEHAATDASAGEAGRAAAARPLQRLALFDPPDAPPFAGYAFIEFAVDEALAASLGTLLEQLGFERAGAHRSKAVTLYRQGAIRLVVNAEAGSGARRRFDEQGPCVCAIGLETDDPLRAAGRGAALLSARLGGPLGPGELDLPAIVAPGGTALHFVRTGSTIDDDFVATRTPPAGGPESLGTPPAGDPGEGSARHEGAGLQRIDHVALGLAHEQFDTWVLFTRAVLALAPGESLELADPFGLIRSGGIANDTRSLRMVLNVSLSDRTRTARQVSASGGSGGSVHHLAFACADIFESVARLRERGVRFVSISPNYYDDLIARLALDEALVRRMQAMGILYDESPSGGRYFHAYTEPFADRFFFEIVQRDAGYDGYGAANAPARMAAQV